MTGATSYQIYKGVNSQSSETYLLTTTSLSYLDTGMYNGNRYWYRIYAYNGTHSLGWCEVGNVLLWLDAPGSIWCNVNGSGHTILSWSPVSGATSYRLIGNPGSPYTTSATSYDLGIIAPYSSYSMSVNSVNSAGNGAGIALNTTGASPVTNALPTYADAQPFCPLCALLHGAGRGDPVNLYTGAEVYSPPADISVYNPNGIGFTFARTFTGNLASSNLSSPGLPQGWTHPYDFVLRTIPAGSTSWPDLEIVYPTGATETLVPSLSGGLPTGAFAHVTGAPYLVSGSPGTGGAWNSVTLQWKDGTKWIFTPFATEFYALTSIVNSVGQGITLTYDASRRLATVVDFATSSSLVSFTYDYYGFLSAINDLYGRSVFYVNGSTGFGGAELLGVSQITPTSVGAAGSSSAFSFMYTSSAGPQIASITVPSPAGSGNATASISYSSGNKVGSVTDGNGNIFAFTYNSGNTVISMKNSVGVVAISYTEYFDSQGRLTSIKDANGKSKSWTYTDPANPYLATTFTDEDSDQTVTTYDAYGNTTSIIDPLSVTTNLTYSYSSFAMGRLMQAQRGTLAATSFTYFEPSGLVNTVTAPEPGGGGTVTSTFAYDALGNLTSATVPGSGSYATRTIAFNYTVDGAYSQPDAIGQPLTLTDNGGNVSHFRYDSQGRQISKVDALGFEIDYTYNIAEQPATIVLPATGQTGPGRSYTSYTYAYPGGPQLSATIYDESGALARTESTTYGAEGEVLSTSGITDSAQYTYDAAYRLLTVKDATGGVTSYAYDGVGNISSETLPGGDVFNFNAYDSAHHLLQKTDANGIVTNYTYTAAGHLISTVNAPLDASVSASLGYDGYGRLTSVTEAVGTRSATYDDNGSVTSEVTSYVGLPARTVSYGFNLDGSRASMTMPAGTFTYGYDAVGRPTSMTNPFGESTAWSYSARGDLTVQALANGAGTTYQYNAIGQLTQLQNLNPSMSVLSSYGGIAYSATGNLKSTAATIGSASGTLSYVYDALDRLTQESSTFGTGYTLAHAYDSNSNLTTLRGATLTYNSKGQLNTTGMSFDNNGNPTTYAGTSLTFDSANRLTSFGTAMTAGYRTDRLRAWKQASGTTTYFLYDGNELLCELDSSGNVIRTYTNGADGLVSSNTAAGSIFYTFDHRGATVHRLDGFGNIVSAHGSDAYGADLNSEADPYSGFGAQFGYYHDAETGLFYLQNRYYDPATGRFVNRDPIGLGGGTNRYGYVSGNPVGGIDPTGLFEWNPGAIGDWLDGVNQQFKHWINSTLTGGSLNQSAYGAWFGILNATAVDTLSDIVFGLPSGLLHTGTGMGTFAGQPNLINGCGAFVDFAGAITTAIGGFELRGLVRAAEGGAVEQYVLVAERDGFYPVMKRCYREPQGGIYLRKGDVWKYGDTQFGPGRYTSKFLEDFHLKYETQFKGTRIEANSLAKTKIRAYRAEKGHLPPGNKIVN